jgi:hypothetical protein
MKRHISIFINQTAGSAFCRVFHHTQFKRRFEGELEFSPGATDTDVLNDVFRRFNVEPPIGYVGPSLSVADVVTLDGKQSFEVLAFGFGLLPAVATGEEFTVELPEPKISEIREWRARAADENRDSSIEAFYRSINMCRRCRGRNHLAGYPENSCQTCGGTGEFPATEVERVTQGLRNMTASMREGAKAV